MQEELKQQTHPLLDESKVYLVKVKHEYTKNDSKYSYPITSWRDSSKKLREGQVIQR